MKKWLWIFVAVGLLTACKNADDVVALVKGVAAVAKAGKASEQVAPPKVSDYGYTLPDYPEPLINSTAQTFKSDLVYKPMKKQVFYFDSKYQIATQAQKGGYYREIIGKTADGRMVGQDFYQDSQTLQTAPFVFAANADIRSFDSDGNVDGLLLQFNPEGRVGMVSVYENGRLTTPIAMYEQGKLMAQIRDSGKEDRFQMAVYHEDGKNIAMVMDFKDKGKTSTVAHFRADGSAIGVINRENGAAQSMHTWNAEGKSVNGKEVLHEVEAIELRRKVVKVVLDKMKQMS